MTKTSKLIIEPLGKKHNRAAFSCGIDVLDAYLQRQASQDIKRRIARVFVLRPEARDNTVYGYYTLSALSIDLSILPRELTKRLPKHPIPAALIGRLAVDSKAQKNGLGNILLADAIKRTLALSDEIAVYAMVVDAINNDAEAFYQGFGFVNLVTASNRLFLPLKSI